MPISQPKRPEYAFNRLIQALEPVSTPIDVVPRKRLLWEHKEKSQLYIFKRGELSVLRASDGLLIATSYEPSVFGFAESFQPLRTHFFRAETTCEILRLDADEGHKHITELGLWKEVADVVSYYTSYLFYRDAMVLQQRTYAIIRNHLLELNKLPLEYRLKVTVLEYIQERTHLSRSGILHVILALKNGNYINIKRGGYLLELTGLPERF
ncbi:helix-turn-helix domain-containing protein [Pseudescherichia vulneris]